AGHALRSFELLREHGLLRYVFPATARIVEGADGEQALKLIREGLRNTDERVKADKPVTPLFLFAMFLWPAIRRRAEELEREGLVETQALSEASDEIIAEQQHHASLPRRFSTPMKEVLALQRRFL